MNWLTRILKKLFGKKPEPQPPIATGVHLDIVTHPLDVDNPLLAHRVHPSDIFKCLLNERACVICGSGFLDIELEGPRAGRCLNCGFPHRPVIIQTQHGNKVVSEDCLPFLERVEAKPKRKGVML